MNMKQSCKALICAIEGELEGRHCTEEQAAAILDHALPSLTEALARVEAKHATWMEQYDSVVRYGNELLAKHDTAQAQLAEAVGLLRYSQEISRLFDDEHTAEVGRFLSSHAQAEQQEAQGALAGDERGAFERKVQDLAERFQPDYRRYGDAGEYKDATLEWAWKLWMARAALATQPADDRAREMGYRNAINALDDLDRYKMAMSPATAAPEATQQQLNDLNNFFNSVCEGGLHSVEKAGIQSLTELGALENCGFGKHRLTRFGTYLLDQPAVRGAEHDQ